MNKRGQFYLVAALIIVGILIGFSFVYNSVSAIDEDQKIYDLTKEIDFEGSKTIDYGIIKGEVTNNNIDSLISLYSENYPEHEIAVIYGNKDEIRYSSYFKITDTGSTGISLGGSSPSESIYQKEQTDLLYYIRDREYVESREADLPFNFRLKEGENFYIILKKDKDNQKYISISDNEN